MKIASVVLFLAIKPNCMLLIFTTFHHILDIIRVSDWGSAYDHSRLKYVNMNGIMHGQSCLLVNYVITIDKQFHGCTKRSLSPIE